MDQAADKQAGRGKEHHREGDFASNQRLAQAQAAAANRTPISHRRPQIDSARGECREHAEEQAGQNRDGQRESQHTAVERNIRDGKKMFRQQEEELL